MQSLTPLFVCTLLLFVALSTEGAYRPWAGAGFNQSIVIGRINPFDRLLEAKNIYLPAKRGQVVVSNLKYPTLSRPETISCIKILDQWFNGTNGNVYLNSGGVGQKAVSLSIRSSKLNLGLHYLVQIFGR